MIENQRWPRFIEVNGRKVALGNKEEWEIAEEARRTGGNIPEAMAVLGLVEPVPKKK